MKALAQIGQAEMKKGLGGVGLDIERLFEFVYGLFDDDRATCEMRSLNRIKAVRHPFPLSLERIEIVDGQLVIITELADASLKDRYDECRSSGLTGIPRDELVGYLRDAADALDFMSERHSLQHLDIKPENLLILAGRIKVADFGLVKEVRDKSMSLMGGLTPIYAAPEVFEGSPSLHSDQYSLAIVYCEMLTGTLPFPGRTAAQLATTGTPVPLQTSTGTRISVRRSSSDSRRNSLTITGTHSPPTPDSTQNCTSARRASSSMRS